MLLAEMSWMDVERYLKQDDRIVVIVGACEQHAYVSLLADVLAPLEIATRAASREGVVVAPPLPYGISPSFAAYPGTISLRPETLATVVREVLAGLLAQGFRRILVSNGHGGNTSVLISVLTETATAHPEAQLGFFEWWRHPLVMAVAEQEALPQHHANWSENFRFTRVGTVPEGHKVPPVIPPGSSAGRTGELLGDGSYGGPYRAPDAIMDRFEEAAVEALAQVLRDL